jgi:hypothetical protein
LRPNRPKTPIKAKRIVPAPRSADIRLQKTPFLGRIKWTPHKNCPFSAENAALPRQKAKLAEKRDFQQSLPKAVKKFKNFNKFCNFLVDFRGASNVE